MRRIRLLKWTTLEYFGEFCIAFFCSYMLTCGFQYKFALLFGFIVSVFIAYRHPLLIISAHFIFSILPTLFHMALDDPYSWRILAKGIGINDIVLCAMIAAILLKMLPSLIKVYPSEGHQGVRSGLGVAKYVVMFAMWLLFEILRNIGLYGLSAPGEFRYHYLILALPLYIAVFFDSKKIRIRLYNITIAACFFIPFLFIPILGELKGWLIGPTSRFFSSSISLGILYGILGSALGSKYGIIKAPKMLTWLMSSAAVLIIIFDTHRSVWFTAAVVLFILVWFKEIQVKRSLKNSPFYAVAIVCVLFTASAVITSVMEVGLFEFIAERGGDIFKIDESYNTTMSWRVAKWKIQVQRFYTSPVAGLGFGAYWGISGLDGDVGISPHNLYIQILVKLGIIGIALYMMIIVSIFRNIRKGIKILKQRKDPEVAILITGVIVLLASHTFYIVYSLEDYSLIFIGLSIAVLRSKVTWHRPSILSD
ncbi:MAG: O-antigen ligase family protein [Nitrospinales bacterium]